LVGLLVSSLQKPNPEELREWMQAILNDDDGDLLTKSIAELAQHFPTLEEVIIRERDAFMACKLHQTCDHMLMGGSVPDHTYRLVAIVGAGHVQGICQWLTEPKTHNETPVQILTRLVQLKKPVDAASLDYLINDIMEVNPELLKDMIQEMQNS
jgi:pheromone shutdown protein TraB